jgi:chromosome partitioning protein
MKTIAFFNNKGGVGKTSLLYHLAHMFARQGQTVVAADFDPQANLTAMFLTDSEIESVWDAPEGASVHSAMRPLIEGTGDLRLIGARNVGERIYLLPGDITLSDIEDELSTQWPNCLGGGSQVRAFRITAGFDRMLRAAGAAVGATLGLIDVGPNLGAINRCALVAADCVLIPVSPDLFAIRGLQNVGPKLMTWRQEWQDRRARAPQGLDFPSPTGEMRPIGYVIARYASFGSGAAKAFQRWLDRAPDAYARAVLGTDGARANQPDDPNCLAQLKDYRSLMALAQEARRPMFLLRPADGAIGGHQAAVAACYQDFERLAAAVAERIEL